MNDASSENPNIHLCARTIGSMRLIHEVLFPPPSSPIESPSFFGAMSRAAAGTRA